MRVQDALANCCQSTQVLASSFANWGVRTVSAIASGVADLARKGYALALPYFATISNFVSVNRIPVAIGAAGVALGALLHSAYNRATGPAHP